MLGSDIRQRRNDGRNALRRRGDRTSRSPVRQRAREVQARQSCDVIFAGDATRVGGCWLRRPPVAARVERLLFKELMREAIAMRVRRGHRVQRRHEWKPKPCDRGDADQKM